MNTLLINTCSVWQEIRRHPWSELDQPVERHVRLENKTRELKYKKLDHNIALLKVDKPFIIGGKIRPICLPSSNLKLSEGTKCATTGWGWTKIQQHLQQQIATILDYDKECATLKELYTI